MTIAPPAATSGPEHLTDRFDVAVLGAGVVGVATAYALARQGLSVALVDKRAAPGGGASYANGAQLSYAYADALGSPAFLRKFPSLMLGADPMFKINLAFDVDTIGWGLRFLGACSGEAQRRGTLETLKLALESQAAMHALLSRHPLTFGHAAPGKMHLYYDRDSFDQAQRGVALKAAHGVRQHLLSSDEARKVEPALEGAAGLVGVVHSPDDEVGDARLFCSALHNVLQQTYAVASFFGFQVADLREQADEVLIDDGGGRRIRAAKVVVAMGVESQVLLRRLGIITPILAMRGYSFNAPLGAAAPRVSLTDTARKLVFCQLGGSMRIAGGAEIGVRSAALDPARFNALVETAQASLPDAADYGRARDAWAGLRPMTPSSTPTIKRATERILLNVGHGMLGWTLALGSGERVANLVLGCSVEA